MMQITRTDVLVVHASKHGATGQIADRIAATLTACGRPAVARPVEAVDDVAGYGAVVVGGAAYYGHWSKPIARFVRAHQSALTARPVWLFSSGPLGTATTDPQGVDVRAAALPKDLAELADAIGARGHRVFFGALDPKALTFSERAVRALPAGRGLLPEGDFRQWQDIDAWARMIADELAAADAATEPGESPPSEDPP
jgi:menaquinone-dependent protoporphyrinogen oxidase